jgi:hypothetical protein
MKTDPLQKTAWYLSLAGFVPFGFLALAMLLLGPLHPMHTVLTDAFRVYAAVILSFLGGIRWGIALRTESARPAALVLSVVPAAIGWLAIFAPPVISIGTLLLAFCAQGAWDSRTFHSGGGLIWFARIRIISTLLVAGALAIALVAVK